MVGVTSGFDEKEMKCLADEGTDTEVYVVEDFDKFDALKSTSFSVFLCPR